MTSVAIIGAGMGGLATALRLRKMGYKVTIFEKQAKPGGRSNVIEEQGFRFDQGPTILVMKSAFEDTYAALGLDINERIEFEQLDPNYRIYFHDNTYIDLFSNMAQLAAEVEKVEPGSAERLFRFVGASAKKYELGMDFVTRNFDSILDLANPVAGVRMLSTGALSQLYGQVGSFFESDKLRKAFSFHSMFLGLSPFDAPAMYSLITYADLVLGMWFPKGGIYAIIEDMLSIADEMGIEIRTNAPVAQILIENGKVTGLQLQNGESHEFDMVVSNADLPYTYRCLVPAEYRKNYTDQKLDRMEYSCSGYLLYLGVDKTYDNVAHQALYFADDYEGSLNAIFNEKVLPDEVSFHLNIPSKSDPTLAPPGHSAIYVLAPMPNLEGNVNWREAAPKVRAELMSKISELLDDPDFEQHIVYEREYTPIDFQNDINAVHGTAFGSLAQGFFQSSYFRPHNKARDIDGLYFVGQGTYPGIGMPMVLISAQLVTERIADEWH